MMKHTTTILLVLLIGLSAFTSSCLFDEPEGEDEIQPVVQPFLNSPGTRGDNDRNRLPSEFVVQQMDQARNSIDVCIYGFSKQNVIDAIVRAHDRGVRVRVVGDARHLGYGNPGYEKLVDKEIPMQVGNQFHIMHNKFFLIDNRFVFVGTGNITSTGFGRNNNNWIYMDSLPVARDFRDEFEQMFAGRFSSAKVPIDNGESYQVGDTEVEVYFSPQENGMGVILEELDKVETSIHFQIFAFTKDEVGSKFINKHRELTRKNERAVEAGEIDADWAEQSPMDWAQHDPDWFNQSADDRPEPINGVVGLLDRSQFHGNGQYHEGYRLQANGVPMRMDANENSRLPGDYQAGGGRLHTKTMILDYGTANARVVTGSFNWSSAATISNDEVLMVLRGDRVVEAYMKGFREMWDLSRTIDGAMCYYMAEPRPACADEVGPDDVLISEIHWDGWNGQTDPSDHTGTVRDEQTNDEFIELYNATDNAINLSMWTIGIEEDFAVGFPPGTVIYPGQYFLVVDHNREPYSEGQPQRSASAFMNPDFVLNIANDPRFPRLNLKNIGLKLQLKDATGEIIDVAGDRGSAFEGGRKCLENCDDGDYDNDLIRNYSMERIIDANGDGGDGTKPGAWKTANGTAGGDNVHPNYRDFIVATPGEPNSE